jgi:hypothetical protein
LLEVIDPRRAGSDGRSARKLVRVVAGSDLAFAILGIAGSIFDPTRILWGEKKAT